MNRFDQLKAQTAIRDNPDLQQALDQVAAHQQEGTAMEAANQDWQQQAVDAAEPIQAANQNMDQESAAMGRELGRDGQDISSNMEQGRQGRSLGGPQSGPTEYDGTQPQTTITVSEAAPDQAVEQVELSDINLQAFNDYGQDQGGPEPGTAPVAANDGPEPAPSSAQTRFDSIKQEAPAAEVGAENRMDQIKDRANDPSQKQEQAQEQEHTL